MKLKPRSQRPRGLPRPQVQVGCAFCWQWVPQPKKLDFTLQEAWGGRCECGAFYVLDQTGRGGGQAVLDITTMACDGDSSRAMKMESGVHYEIKTKPLVEQHPQNRNLPTRPFPGVSKTKVWFLRLKEPLP